MFSKRITFAACLLESSEYPRESIEGVKNTHMEDIILLATLAVTKFPKCSGALAIFILVKVKPNCRTGVVDYLGPSSRTGPLCAVVLGY